MKTAYGKLIALIFALVVGLLLFAPMRSGNEDTLTVHPRNLLRMKPGDSFALSYELEAETEQSVRFSSSDERVATVSDDGTITAVGVGKARVTLSADKGARSQVQVEVVGTGATQLALNTSVLELEKGQVTSLRAVFDSATASDAVSWSSADEKVARVDAAGRVSAVGGGTTTIYAASRDGLTASAAVSVHVKGTAVHITPEALTLGTGSAMQLGTAYLPADTTDSIERWTSSDPAILSVQNNGSVIAMGPGQAVISVFSKEGLMGSTIVNVEPSAAEFSLSPAAATIERGTVLHLEARFTDALGQAVESSSGHHISWSSSDPQVASVSEGVVTALRTGSTTITASADGQTAVCNLSVQTLVHEVRLNLESVDLLREQTATPIQLEAQVIPEDADNTRLTYSVDNELVASVDQYGLVTLTGGYGSATITARAESGAQAQFVVNVISAPPEG